MRGLFGIGKKKEEEQKKETPSSGETKYIVQYNRKACIGAGVCAAVDGKHWEMLTDGKAHLKASSQQENVWTREITEAEFKEVSLAADGCPPRAISIIKKDTGEKVV